jgi:hypothetical protein
MQITNRNGQPKSEQTIEMIDQGVASESNKCLSSPFECVQRCLIGAIKGTARFRQGSHKCGP